MNERTTPKEDYEKAYCKICSAVYFVHAWHWSDHKRMDYERQGLPSVTCPACYKIQNDLPGGIISLIGISDKKIKNVILGDVKDLVAQAMDKNPLDRIISVNEKSDEIVVYTTDAQLAKKVGRDINRRYHGSLSVDSSGGEELARVVWISSER